MKTLFLLPLILTVSSLGQTSPAKHSTPKKDRAPDLVLAEKAWNLNDTPNPPEQPHRQIVTLDAISSEVQARGGDFADTAPKPPKGWKFYCTLSPTGVNCAKPPETAYKSIDSTTYGTYLAHGYPVALRNQEGRWCEMHLDFSTCWEIPGQGGGGLQQPLPKVNFIPLATPSEFIGFVPGCRPTRGDELDEYAEWVVPQHTEVKAEKATVPEPKLNSAYAPTWTTDDIIIDTPVDIRGQSYSISSDGHSRIATLTQAEQHDLAAATEALEVVKKKIAEEHGVRMFSQNDCMEQQRMNVKVDCDYFHLPVGHDRYSISSGYIFINVEGK